MENEFTIRFRNLALSKSSSLKRFANDIGFTEKKVGNINREDTKPALDLFQAIGEAFPDVDLHELITGKQRENAVSKEDAARVFNDVLFTAHRLNFLKVNTEADLKALTNLFVEKLTGEKLISTELEQKKGS